MADDPAKTDGGAGADPATKTEDTTTQSFDPSKISDDEFAKVFDDPRTFQHSRFKQLTAKAAEADKLKEAQGKAEQDKLAAEGKFKELAEAREQEVKTLQDKLQSSELNRVITSQAQKLGAVDPEAVIALINRNAIKFNEDGSIAGVDDALKVLAQEKTYLFKNPNANLKIGEGTSPGDNQNPGAKKFKLSEIQKMPASEYAKHSKEIDEAMKAGSIEDDVYGTQTGPR